MLKRNEGSALAMLAKHRRNPGELEGRVARVIRHLLRVGLDLEAAAAVAHNAAAASLLLEISPRQALNNLTLEELAAEGRRWSVKQGKAALVRRPQRG